MSKSRKLVIAVLAIPVSAIIAIVVLALGTMPRNRPDEARAKRDFLAEHPAFAVERVTFEEHEVGFVAYRVFYR